MSTNAEPSTLESVIASLPEIKSLYGVMFAVFGNMMISVAINVQKYAHNRLQKQLEGTSLSEKPIIASSEAGDLADATSATVANFRSDVLGDDSDDEPTLGNNPSAAAGSGSRRPDDLPMARPQGSDGSGQDLSSPMAGRLGTSFRPQDKDRSPLSGDTTVSIDMSREAGDISGNSHSATASDPKASLLGASEDDGDGYEEGDESDEDSSFDAVKSDHNYLKSKYWWLGMTMMVSGEAGNFLAYGYAPASVVAPLGTVALISNAILAPIMLKEKFRPRDFLGIVCAITGAVVVVMSSKSDEVQLSPDAIVTALLQPKFLIYTGINALGIGGLIWLSDRCGEKFVVVDLGLVAIFGGYTVLSTKAISSLLGLELIKMFAYPITYLALFILVSTAVLQIKYLNKALQRFDSTQVIPTQFVLFTVAAIAGGGVLYNDFEKMTATSALTFVAGCALTFLGVYFITSKRVLVKAVAVSVAAEVSPDGKSQSAAPPRKISHTGSISYGEHRSNGSAYGDYELKGWGAEAVLDEDDEGDFGGFGTRRLSNYNSDASGWRRQWRNTGGDRFGNGPETTDSIFAQRGAVFWGSVRKASDQAKAWWLRTIDGTSGPENGTDLGGSAHVIPAGHDLAHAARRKSRRNTMRSQRHGSVNVLGVSDSRRSGGRPLPDLGTLNSSGRRPSENRGRANDAYRRLTDDLV